MSEILDNIFFGEPYDDEVVAEVLEDIAYIQERSNITVHNGRTESDYASNTPPQAEPSLRT